MNWIGLFQKEVERNKLLAQQEPPKPQAPARQANLVQPTMIGENGTLEYSADEVGDALVALFFALVRDIPATRITGLLNACLSQASLRPSESRGILSDLFVLAFQTRDCRGGKGERSIFYQLLIDLYKSYSFTVLALLPLIAEYGYYKDYFNILAMIDTQGNNQRYGRLQDKILDLVSEQLFRDEEALDRAQLNSTNQQTSSASISLCAKYAPRESRKFEENHKAVFKALVLKMFPATTESAADEEMAYMRSKRLYRKMISKLCNAIDIPEVKMCGKRFSSIDFEHVPSISMKKYRKAFANEKLKVPLTHAEMQTGNRSMEIDRIECRQHLMTAVQGKKIKGKQNFPHDIVRAIMHSRPLSPVQQATTACSLEIDVLQQQWEDIRNEIVKSIAEKTQAGESKGIHLGKLMALVDVSGSMSGTPMEVAIALGILISEVNHPLFRDRFITFHSNPSWVDLSAAKSLAEKVAISQRAPWGGSTNIAKAFELIAQMVERHNIPESEIPDLIIFSDMQFDMAVGRGQRQTQLQRIAERFAALGKKMSGKPYAMPRIIFWNLRGDTKGFPAQATSANVEMLSGFSPALFKHVVEGDEMTKKGRKVNPYDTFRKVVDDERYDKIREIVAQTI